MQIDITKHWGDNEIFYQAELSSKIIYSMQQYGKVVLISREARSLEHSGLNLFLDALCDFWHWDSKNIVIVSNNFFEPPSQYTIQPIFLPCHSASKAIPRHVTWDGSKSYGMFLGRATAERLQAVHRHQNFDFREQGLTSFHHDVKKYIDTSELLEYLCESDSRYSELMQLVPYSDIGDVDEQIIGHNMHADWESVYKQIALELVFETSTADDACTFSEKIIRPMIYGRPFMLVASRYAISRFSDPEFIAEHFKNLVPEWNFKYYGEFAKNWPGVKFFENVFGTDYHSDHGIHRVNHIFDILHTLIKTGKINQIHDKCRSDLENNFKCVLLLQTLLKKMAVKQTMGAWQTIVNKKYAGTK